VIDVCILLVSWNHSEKTLACLKSVAGLDYPSKTILLVDNGSQDDTVNSVRSHYPDVNVLELAQNQGFAGGYNAGLNWALEREFKYILLLNNDTILHVDCLSSLVDEAEIRPKAGLLTAKIFYTERPHRIWTVGGKISRWNLEIFNDFRGAIDRGQWETPLEIDFAPLCGVLLRRTLIEEIGLLDEEFFLYYEDLDYCWRIHQSKFEIWMIPRAKIWHDVSASSGGNDSPQERYWMAQSSGRYFRKHSRLWQYVIIIPFRFGSAFKTSVRLAVKTNFRALLAYWYGLIVGWSSGRSTKPPPSWLTLRYLDNG